MYRHSIRPPAAVVLATLILAPSVFAGPAEDQFTVASRHYARQRWKLAADEFQAFVEEFPDHERADAGRFLRGESLVQLGKFEEARRQFLEFLRRAPDDHYSRQARFRAGETAFLLDDHAAAKPALKEFRKRHPQDPLNAYALAYLGEIALESDDAEQAEEVYREALQNFTEGPLGVEYRFGLARSLELQDKAEEAIRFYRFLADHHRGPMADDAQLRIGILHYDRGQYDQAAAALEKVQTEFPDSNQLVRSLYWLGAARLAQDRPEQAAAVLKEAHRQAEEHPLADAITFSLADAIRETGDRESASTHYRRVVKEFPHSDWAADALQILVTLALERGDYARVHQRAETFLQEHAGTELELTVRQADGRAFLKEQRYAEAIAVLEDVVETAAVASPDSSPASETVRFLDASHYYLGLAYLGAKRHADALSQLDRIRSQPEQPALRDGVAAARAFALAALERHSEAIAPLRAYLEAQPEGPDSADCRAKLIVALAETGRLEEASRVHRTLHERNRDHEGFLPTTEYLAHAAQNEGKQDLARQLLEVLADQENPAPYQAKGLARLGRLQLAEGQAAESAETFRQLIAASPDVSLAAEAALLRARALKSTEQYDDALGAYEVVFSDYPESNQAAPALFGAAQLHVHLNQNQDARDLLERLIDEHEGFPQTDAALYQLGWVLIDLQQPEEAYGIFARLGDRHPDSPYWSDAVYRLAEHAFQTGNRQRAAERLEQLLEAGDDGEIVPHALYLKGQLAADQKRWADVVGPMQRITEEFAESALRIPAQYWRAEAKYRLGEYAEAEAILSSLSASVEEKADAWLAMIPLRRAQLAAHREDWEAAYELASGIADHFPDFRQQYEADYLIGRCLSSQARFSEARDAYERVVRSAAGGRTETAAMAQWMIGESYFHQKEYDRAIRAYHRVESLYGYPHWQAAALLQAGKCHELQGQWKQAVQLYAQLLKEHPESDYADEASQRLQVAQKQATTAKTK